MSCALNYMFSIDGHLLQVIEADGVNHNPVVVDSLQIFAGQRYSVVVSTDDKSNTEMLIRSAASCSGASE